MFDIAFSELLLVGLVALLVLGPERLPAAARVAGLWIGRIKRSFANVRDEVEREIGADEIRRQLHNENILAKERKELEQTLQQGKESLEQVRESVGQGSQALNENLDSAKQATEDVIRAQAQNPVQEPASVVQEEEEQPAPEGQGKHESNT